jgi:hypothetical protein
MKAIAPNLSVQDQAIPPLAVQPESVVIAALLMKADSIGFGDPPSHRDKEDVRAEDPKGGRVLLPGACP